MPLSLGLQLPQLNYAPVWHQRNIFQLSAKIYMIFCNKNVGIIKLFTGKKKKYNLDKLLD